MELLLERFFSSPKYGTFGRFSFGDTKLYTLERPWEDNRPWVSSIPTGIYKCSRVNSPKFGDTFAVDNVPNRTHILIHAANVVSELQGCIALGTDLGVVYGSWGIVNSRKAMNEFFDYTKGVDEFKLAIRYGKDPVL